MLFAKENLNISIEQSDIDDIPVDKISKERRCIDCVQFMPLGHYDGICRFQDFRDFIDGRRDASWCPVYHKKEEGMW